MAWGIIDKTLEGRQQVYFPHWYRQRCPTEGDTNLRYRQHKFATSSSRERKLLWKMCKEDFLFYLYTFVWLFKAKENPGPKPFNAYPFQVECFTMMWKCMHDGQEDMRMKKPRDVGATWMVMTLFDHAWHFMPNVHLLVGSRKEDEIDGTSKSAGETSKAGQWSKLLPKIDFIHLHQPKWMLPDGYRPRTPPFRSNLNIVNPDNGSLITGESANAKFGRSGRYYAIGFDEHAHTEQAHKIIGACSQTSDCHFWWSSPDGPSTAFAMLGRSKIQQINLNWWMHPLHAEEMTFDPVKGDRSRTSPWFVKEMNRIGNDPVLANNEIWADESQSSGSYFHRTVFDTLLGVGDEPGTVCDPVSVGEIDFTLTSDGPQPSRWLDQESGNWKLWLNLDHNGEPPHDERYILGIDVAAGTTDAMGRGASNSTIEVIGTHSRKKVAEYATHGMPAHKFAELCLAAARWFSGSEHYGYMIWDAGGQMGGAMASVIVEDNGIRHNIYWRTSGTSFLPGYIQPGSSVSGGIWGDFVKIICSGQYTETSRVMVEDEMRHYYANPNGGAPVHASSKSTEDPSGARANHGDRTTATVLATIELKKRMDESPSREKDEPPFGSWLHSEKLRKKRDLVEARI